MPGSFDPVHAAHAIERVTAALVFDGSVDGNAWLPVSRALEIVAKKLELEKYDDLVGFIPQWVPAGQGQLPTISFSALSGARFVHKDDEEQDIISVFANRSGITVESHRYIRWSGFEEILQEVVDVVVKAFPKELVVGQVRLEYQDRFIENSTEEPRASWREVLREGDHISTDHLNRNTAWHTHVGWFEDHSDIGRLLLNLNVDASAETPEAIVTPRSISLFSLASSVTPGSVGRDTAAIMARFDRLHTRSKIAVRSILTPAMQSRISIDVDEKKT